MENVIITAETVVDVPLTQARQWFLSLERHPERYVFATHAGFQFIEGSFGEVGARFETQERFYGLRFTLRFALTQVTSTRFDFRLLRPALPVWGAFVLEARAAQSTQLRLAIGGSARLGTLFLKLPVVRPAIRRQITAEVEHIRAAIESIA